MALIFLSNTSTNIDNSIIVFSILSAVGSALSILLMRSLHHNKNEPVPRFFAVSLRYFFPALLALAIWGIKVQNPSFDNTITFNGIVASLVIGGVLINSTLLLALYILHNSKRVYLLAGLQLLVPVITTFLSGWFGLKDIIFTNLTTIELLSIAVIIITGCIVSEYSARTKHRKQGKGR